MSRKKIRSKSKTKIFRFRSYPTKNQIKKFDQFFGAHRFVYNHFLALKKDHYKSGLKFSSFEDACLTLTQLRKSLDWMQAIHSQACQAALKDLH